MSGGEVEQEVILDVDGGAVGRAFDNIEARIKAIQTSIDKVQQKARAAADAFGGNLQKTITDLNKTVSTLERFQKTVDKYDPAAIKARETEQVYRQGGIIARDEAKKTADYDRALAQTRAQQEREVARTSTLAWTDNDKQRRRQDVERQRAQRLADQELTRQYLADQRAADQQRLKDQRTFEQNRVKQARDVAQQNVANATPRQLAAMQAASSANLQDLRGQRGAGSADEQRRLEQDIVLEKEYLRLVQQRLGLTATSDARINAGLDLRSGKLDEKALNQQLGLNAAKVRQADLEASIAGQIQRTYKLTGEEKISAEQALKIDEARLGIVKQRVRQLETEAAAQAKASRPSNSGGGMFGSSGLLGVVGRTAAYGGAAAAIYGTISTIKEGITEAIHYEDSIQKIGAIAHLTNAQMGDLSATIEGVAENTRFARQEITDATTVLAQAGFSADDIKASLSAIAQLAAASGSSFAEATDVVTSAIGAFNLGAGDAQHIADSLTAALNLTKLNIQQVALGIQYAGATAYENNMTFEDLTATMAALAQAGIKSGSTMGTGVRQLLALLLSPTKRFAEELKSLGVTMDDINVKTNGLAGVMDNLTKAGFTAADAYKAMGTRGAAVYLALRNQSDIAAKVALAQSQQKGATEANAKAMDSLTAQWQRYKNQLNDTFTNGMKPVSDWLKDWLKSANEAEARTQELGKALDYYNSKIDGSAESKDRASEAMQTYVELLDETSQREKDHAAAAEEVETNVNRATEAHDHETQVLSSLNDAITQVSVRKRILTQDSAALEAETLNLEGRFQGLAEMLNGTALSYDNLTKALMRYRMAELQKVALTGVGEVNAAQGAVGQYAQAGGQDLHALKNSPFYAGLPSNIKKAIETARTSTGMDRAQAVIIINDYANDPKNGMLPLGSRMLRDYAGDVSKLGLSMGRRGDAQMDVDTAKLLMGKTGQDLYSRIQATNDEKGLNSIVKDIANRMHGKTGPAANALNSLLQQAATKLSLVQPPQPQTGSGRTKHNGLPARQDRAVDAEAIKADEAQLKQALKGIGDARGHVTTTDANGNIVVNGSRGLTLDRLRQNLERISNSDGTGALDQWVSDRTQQVEDQLKHLKLDKNSGKGKQIWDDLQREIDAKKEETQRSVGEALAKALQKMVDAAEQVAKAAEEVADHALNMTQARVSALQRANLNGKVPDYVQATVERQAAYAKDNRDAAQIPIDETKLAALQKAFSFISGGLDVAKGLKLAGVDDPAIKSLTDLNTQITTLSDHIIEAKASFGGEGLIPPSFNANLQMAIANFREVNHLGMSWTQMLEMNLTGALDTASGALTQFFSDILSGNVSVAQSFGNMARAVIGYIGQMIAKMIAMKVLETALNLIGSVAGAKAATNPFDTTGANPLVATHNANVMAGLGFGKIYGGQVTALTGRYITDGVPNRDTVNARIAKGEYVTRKSAVDSVGVDFMRDLNNRGKAALGQFGPKVVMPAPAHQMMNVYVVQEDRPPTMGPKDVLVTIANDIYRNGPTKQLIKQVAQGG